MPEDMRRQDLFERVPTIVGINSHDGAKIASKLLNNFVFAFIYANFPRKINIPIECFTAPFYALFYVISLISTANLTLVHLS